MAALSSCRPSDAAAAAPRKGAAVWASSMFEEWTMWERTSARERGTSRRDVICAWLIAVAVLGCLMGVTALQPLISEPSALEASQAAAKTQEQTAE